MPVVPNVHLHFSPSNPVETKRAVTRMRQWTGKRRQLRRLETLPRVLSSQTMNDHVDARERSKTDDPDGDGCGLLATRAQHTLLVECCSSSLLAKGVRVHGHQIQDQLDARHRAQSTLGDFQCPRPQKSRQWLMVGAATVHVYGAMPPRKSRGPCETAYTRPPWKTCRYSPHEIGASDCLQASFFEKSVTALQTF